VKPAKQELSLLQIVRVEAFGEPVVDRGKKLTGLIPLALIILEPRHANGRCLKCLLTMIFSNAKRYVEEGQRIVGEQKGRIARFWAAGFDTLDAERTLSVLEANLNTFQEHRRSLEREEQ